LPYHKSYQRQVTVGQYAPRSCPFRAVGGALNRRQGRGTGSLAGARALSRTGRLLLTAVPPGPRILLGIARRFVLAGECGIWALMVALAVPRRARRAASPTIPPTAVVVRPLEVGSQPLHLPRNAVPERTRLGPGHRSPKQLACAGRRDDSGSPPRCGSACGLPVAGLNLADRAGQKWPKEDIVSGNVSTLVRRNSFGLWPGKRCNTGVFDERNVNAKWPCLERPGGADGRNCP
jgi:hypothetical protein